MAQAKEVTINTLFPILISVAILISCGLYAVTPIKDREDGLRYLLNFSGQSSAAYYAGMFLADLVIYIVPIIAITIVAFILKVSAFTDHIGPILLDLFLLGLGLINITYVIAFIFKKSEAGFKFTYLLVLV